MLSVFLLLKPIPISLHVDAAHRCVVQAYVNFHSSAVISNALRESETLLKVDETSTKVRRRDEVREPKGQFERSVYAVCCWLVLCTRE